MSFIGRLERKIRAASKSAPSDKFLNNHVFIGGHVLTKRQFNKIADMIPSKKVMDSKAARKAIENGQIEGLK